MGHMATEARERMIRTTGRLLRQQGYHGTGLNQIVAEAGAPKGSMYFYFPGGKAELAAAAVDRYAGKVTELLLALLAEHGTAAGAVAAYLDRMATGFDERGFADGCTVASAAAEVAPNEPVIGSATKRALVAWTEALAARLVAEGHPGSEAHRLATAAITLIEGAIVMAKGTQSTDPVREVRDTVVALLTPPPRGRRR